MTTASVTPALSTAALVAIIELLTQPEYGQDWLAEEIQASYPSDETIDELDETVAAALKELSLGFVAQLPLQVRALYDPAYRAQAAAAAAEACGDYPAPCNCDDPETHNGH